MARIDPHSYADDTQPRTRHLRWKCSVDFPSRTIEGDAVLELQSPGNGPMDLDTKALTIESVDSPAGPVTFELGPEDPILGRRLRLELPHGTREVRIRYRTSAEAIGLQWLAPEQTAGRRHPFLFTQFQSIHARTVIPLQDTPAIRITYEAEMTIPEQLSAVMSAGPGEPRPADGPGKRALAFRMPQPIPTYLIAFAVGHLESRDLSARSRVWAEPETVEKAAWEFIDIEKMIVAAEKMFGPYEWERYDMIVLPPSFPYGGMENPRMTYLTPTLLAGDRSLVNVVAHELAHSWTGNLVTNATMEHFWLNEGFTDWAERRIDEAIWGERETTLHWAIGQKDLDASLARFGQGSPMTVLRMKMEGVDPDDAYSSIPYEKGARFVVVLERAVGRPAFDSFIREYIDRFRFTSITTEQFLEFLEQKFPGLADRVHAKQWLYEPDMPADAPVFHSSEVEELTKLAQGWDQGVRPTAEQINQWNAAEMLIYLQNLPHQMDRASCEWLDQNLKLTGRGNYEILVEWLTIAGGSDYDPAFQRIREVLSTVGRMKYLRPLFGALGKTPRTRKLARDIFGSVAPSYHALSRRVAESMIEKYPE